MTQQKNRTEEEAPLPIRGRGPKSSEEGETEEELRRIREEARRLARGTEAEDPLGRIGAGQPTRTEGRDDESTPPSA